MLLGKSNTFRLQSSLIPAEPSQLPAREDICITSTSEVQPLPATSWWHRRNSYMQKPSWGYAVLLLFTAQVFPSAKGLGFPPAVRAPVNTWHFWRPGIKWLCPNVPALIPCLLADEQMNLQVCVTGGEGALLQLQSRNPEPMSVRFWAQLSRRTLCHHDTWSPWWLSSFGLGW